MDYYDLIIVGAGPAGSTLAHALQDSGKRILVIDKQDFPRDKTCAGWVTPAVMDSLDIDINHYGTGRTLQPIRRFRIGMMGQSAVENDHGEIVSYGIRRCEFDAFLLDRTAVPKQLNTPVKSIVRRDGNWVINDTWEAPLIVGAGGHFCPVAKLMGDGPGSHEVVVAAKAARVRPVKVVQPLITSDHARTGLGGRAPEQLSQADGAEVGDALLRLL